MMDHLTSETLQRPEGNIFFLSGGPVDGTPLIFVHGWPGIPETWRPQLKAFASLGFRVIAPANRGYNRSVIPKQANDYTVEQIVADLRALLQHLELPKAVWIGHDWGCGPVWALAAHHPEICMGIINLCVPYRTLELGLEDGLLPYVNRNIYPVDQYPYGQWDYQHFYETNFSTAVEEFSTEIDKIVKAFYAAGGRAPFGTPSPTATVSQRGRWLVDKGTDVPLNKTVLDEQLYKELAENLKEGGFFGPCAWYVNHATNKKYAESSVNGGVLHMPVLFIEARFDVVCDTALSTLSNPMRAYCQNLTQCSINAGHWVALEKPRETNAAIARWLATSLPNHWPGYWQTPLVQQS